MPKSPFVAATALVYAVCAYNAQAEIYTWTDANGVTHYSDQPPETSEHENLATSSLPPLHLIDKPDPALTHVLQKATRAQQVTRRAASTTPRRSAAANNRCAKYRSQLKKLQSQLRRGYKEPRGNALRERRRKLQARLNAEC